MFDINDLGAVKMSDPKNNNQLLGFIEEWDEVLLGAIDENNEPTIRERELELMLYDRIQLIPWIQYDIERYKRAERGDPIKCYEFLYNSVDRALREHNQIRNRQSIAKKRGVKAHAAPAPHRGKSGNRGKSGGSRGPNNRGRSGGRNGNQNNGDKREKSRGRSKGRSHSQNRGRSSSRGNDNICISWKKSGHCPRGGKSGTCKYEHPEEKRGSSKGRKSKSRSGSNKGRRSSPATPGPADKKKAKSKSPAGGKVCWRGADCEFHKKGQCHFVHADAAAPATKKKNRRNKSKGKQGN